MGWTLRAATEADLPRIVALLDQLSQDDAREELGPPLSAAYADALRAVLSDKRQTLLVVEAEGRVVATACVVIVPSLSYRARPYAIVEDVVVDAAERSRGWGELLMRRAIEIAREAGCHKVALTCNRTRQAAQRFYERLGFQGTHIGYRIDF